MLRTQKYLALALLPAVLMMSASNCNPAPAKGCADYKVQGECQGVSTCEWVNDACRVKEAVKPCGDNKSDTACAAVATCEWANDVCQYKLGSVTSCADYGMIPTEEEKMLRCDSDNTLKCQFALDANTCVGIDKCANFNAIDCPNARVGGGCSVSKADGSCVATPDADKTCKPSHAKCAAWNADYLPYPVECRGVKSGSTSLCQWTRGSWGAGGTCSAIDFATFTPPTQDPCAAGTTATCGTADPYLNCELR